ncbi:protein POLYCHOME-like [Pistacia vera]|uniref:protein POLYCHOME-like n=1 Tax=Pistacia vera TaxID=55513 RepID=UPI001262EC99|nr:protein POLYCHOME-like [Pistacia vera]
MAKSHGRLVTVVDFATLYTQITREANTAAARGQSIGGGRGGGLGTPRSAFGRGRRNLYGCTSATGGPMGRENTQIGSVRRGSSVLPAWYPRRPLRDVTAVVREIERRGARLGAAEGLQIESPMSQDQRVVDSPEPLLGAQLEHNTSDQRVVDSPEPLSGAQLEHNTSMLSPNPTFHKKHCLPKILLHIIANQAGGELESLTPQKKLLNSIVKVEKVIIEELGKLKRTPSARTAEREKRVGTLMSMR